MSKGPERLARISAKILLIAGALFIGLAFIGSSKDKIAGLASFLLGIVCLLAAIRFETFANELERDRKWP